MEATNSERYELQEGLRRISIGLGLMIAAAALPLLMRYSPMPFLDMRLTSWISIILDGIALAYLIPGLLRLTAAPESLRIKDLALYTLGGVVLEPLTRVMQQLMFAFSRDTDLSVIWFVAGLVEAAAYGLLAFLMWRIELGTSRSEYDIAAPELAKAPGIIMAGLGLAGLIAVLRLSLLFSFHLLHYVFQPAYVALFVVLFIIVKQQRDRLIAKPA